MRYLPVLILLAAVGCGESPAPQSAATSQPASRAASQVAQGAAEKAASDVAERFLGAVLRGDSRAAAELLTTRALAQHAQDPSTLSSMGLEVERLEVAQALMLNEDEAAVACLITEPGSSEPAELCCLLKRETAGWRVCGLASDAEDGSPAIISFEGDPVSPGESYRQLVTEGVASRPEKTASAPTEQTVR